MSEKTHEYTLTIEHVGDTKGHSLDDAIEVYYSGAEYPDYVKRPSVTKIYYAGSWVTFADGRVTVTIGTEDSF